MINLFKRLKRILSKTSTTRHQRSKTEEQHQAWVQPIQQRYHEAWRHMQQDAEKRHFKLASRPWVILLGTPASGKTSSLQTNQLALQSPQGQALPHATRPTQLLDVWVSPKAGFLDMEAAMALACHPEGQARWATLLQLMYRHRLTRSIHQVLLFIDLPTLHTSPQTYLEALSTQLSELQSLAAVLPVSLVISYCDLIPGFNAFFDDLDTEERQQCLHCPLDAATHLTQLQTHPSLTASFDHAFTQLVDYLYSRLIRRLHREYNVEKRWSIATFLSTLSELSKPIHELLARLPFNQHIVLQDVYFTAQSPETNDFFFVESLLPTVLAQKPHRAEQPPRHAKERFVLPITASIALGGIWLTHQSYHQTSATMAAVQQHLTAPAPIPLAQRSAIPGLGALIPLSQVLEATDAVVQPPLRFYEQWLGVQQLKQIHNAAAERYHQILTSKWLNYIRSILLTQLKWSQQKNSVTLFDTLKTYLSMTSKAHDDPHTILNWYRHYWATRWPEQPSLQAQLAAQLAQLLQQGAAPWFPPDQALIQQAQATLQGIPLEKRAFLTLQDDYPPIEQAIFPQGTLEGVDLRHAKLPPFFSNSEFKKIYNQSIPNIIQLLDQSHWVFGGAVPDAGLTAAQKQQLIQATQALYLQAYTRAWAKALKQIKLSPAPNYTALQQRISILLDPHSDLMSLLHLVMGNVTLDTALPADAQLQAVQQYINQKGRYTNVQAASRGVQQVVSKLQTATPSDPTRYYLAQARFLDNPAEDPIGHLFQEAALNPEPIRSWLNGIAKNSWVLLLQDTRAYLNAVWKTTVLPLCHHDIVNHYPIFSAAQTDISLDNFLNFFGPKGAVGHFFVEYLQPFVDMSRNYWTWKQRNGIGLLISQARLDTFIRASLIQSMFFLDDHTRPGFRFVLLPIKLPETLSSFSINLGGQLYQMAPDSPSSGVNFAWPGPKAAGLIIQWAKRDGTYVTQQYNGPWAWFRLIDASFLHSTPSPQQFTLAIPFQDQAAQFQLNTEHRINPFIPGILQQYRCPETL